MLNVPVVILCGGTGTRLREETQFIPKPMVPIGGKPMIWHIMKLYHHYGVRRFILALGYKQEIFKEYFTRYHLINNDVTVSRYGCCTYPTGIPADNPDWSVTLVDTGENTTKGARLKQVMPLIQAETFMVTYGDGIADIDIDALYSYHMNHGRLATITGIHPRPRFGEMVSSCRVVESFLEKPANDNVIINGGFFVFDRAVLGRIDNIGNRDLETWLLPNLVTDKQLMVYRHQGYWGCMDTIKDMHELDQLWREGNAKWKVW